MIRAQLNTDTDWATLLAKTPGQKI